MLHTSSVSFVGVWFVYTEYPTTGRKCSNESSAEPGLVEGCFARIEALQDHRTRCNPCKAGRSTYRV